MLNILKALTHHLLQAEEREEESCDIPDENLIDWREQVADELQWLQQRPDKHRQRIEQLQEILTHLDQVIELRKRKSAAGGHDA